MSTKETFTIFMVTCVFFMVKSMISSDRSEEVYPNPNYDRQEEKIKSYIYLVVGLICFVCAFINWKSYF